MIKFFKKLIFSLPVRIFFRLIEEILFFFHKVKLLNNHNSRYIKYLYFRPNHKISKIMRQTEIADKSNQKYFQLVNDGFVKIGSLSNSDIDNAKDYFYSKKIYNAHQKVFSDGKENSVNDFINYSDNFKLNYASFSQNDSVNFINKYQILKKIEYKKIFGNYFNKNSPKIISIETMLSRHSDTPAKYLQTFHRDFDSVRGLVMFIYWSETNENNGSTQIIKGSHKKETNEALDESFLNQNLTSLNSNAGDVFLMDPFVMHRGSPVLKSIRLVTWIRLSYFPSLMYYMSDSYKEKESYDKLNMEIRI